MLPPRQGRARAMAEASGARQVFKLYPYSGQSRRYQLCASSRVNVTVAFIHVNERVSAAKDHGEAASRDCIHG